MVWENKNPKTIMMQDMIPNYLLQRLLKLADLMSFLFERFAPQVLM
jgi:hypothetical protein